MSKPSPWIDAPPSGIVRLGAIPDDQKLYRYMSFERFKSWIETGTTYLTKASSWPDKHEMPIQDVLSEEHPDEYRKVAEAYDLLYGQCWSLSGDLARLWDSHAPDPSSVMVETSAAKLNALENDLAFAVLSPIIYHEDSRQGSELAVMKYLPLPILVFFCTSALVKKPKFDFENEVRLVAVNPDSFGKVVDGDRIPVRLAPDVCIERITMNPCATDQDMAAVQELCTNKGLNIDLVRSSLNP